MPNTKDIDLLNSPAKLLLLGGNGTGKTIGAAGFHKLGPIEIEDADVRIKPVKAFYPDADINYNVWTSDNFHKFCNKIHKIIDGEYTPKFKTWVIDSVTSFSITCVVYQLKIKDKVKTTKGGMPVTSWDEINGETVFFHEMIEACQILYDKFDVNIIWTGHPVAKTEGMGDDAKKVTSLAAYGNKIPSIVPGYFDEIYNFHKVKVGMTGEHKVQVYTIPEATLPGKTALFNYLPNSFDITDKNFYEVWRSYLVEKEVG